MNDSTVFNYISLQRVMCILWYDKVQVRICPLDWEIECMIARLCEDITKI